MTAERGRRVFVKQESRASKSEFGTAPGYQCERHRDSPEPPPEAEMLEPAGSAPGVPCGGRHGTPRQPSTCPAGPGR